MRDLGLRRRDKSSLDKPWEGPAVVRKLDRSVLKVEVGSWTDQTADAQHRQDSQSCPGRLWSCPYRRGG